MIMETGNERCPKFPSILKANCSHCQGLERGTADNPRFTLSEGLFDGWPVVEVLKNGGPVHVWDEHFRFGERKAEILIACVDILREFWQSTDDEKRTFASRQERGLVIRIYIEMRRDFERSTGTTVDRPWLCLHALPPDNVRIGLGTMKCQAICAVEKDLQKWLLERKIQQKIQRAEEILEQLRRRQAK